MLSRRKVDARLGALDRGVRGIAFLALLFGAATGPGCAADPAAAPLDRRANEVLAKEWQLYLREDEQWPAARERWLAGPPSERQLLLDNLLRELMADDSAGRGNGTSFRSARARRELTWFGSEAIAPLVEGLRGLGARERVDGVVIERITNGLVELHAFEELAGLSLAPTQGRLALQVRTEALRGLATLDDPRVGEVLCARLREDPDWQVRGVAAELLRRRTSDPRSRPALAAAVGDPDGFVRAQAVRSLTENGDISGNSVPLADVIHFLTRDPERAVRVAAAEALSLYSFEPAVEAALIAALQDPEVDVVGKAAQSLLNCETRAAQYALVDALDRANRLQVRDGRAAGLVSEILRILAVNLRATPKKINPAGWRALLDERWRGE